MILFCSPLGPMRSVAASIAAAAALLAVTPPGVVPSDLGTGIGDKAMHGIVAAVVALVLLADLRSSREPWMAAGRMGALVLAAGSVELVQPLFGRSAEWLDWVAAAVGIVGAWCVLRLCRALLGRTHAGTRRECS